jgi:hypothetical protein
MVPEAAGARKAAQKETRAVGAGRKSRS